MDGNYNQLSGLTCCFCNEDIRVTKVDPCDISIMANWTDSGRKKQDQTFWCHLACFRDKMHTDVAKYLVIDIISANDEDNT